MPIEFIGEINSTFFPTVVIKRIIVLMIFVTMKQSDIHLKTGGVIL